MTRVYFLRHGKAENRAEWRGSDDERPLTAEGEEAMRREAEALRALGLAPDVIVTSPLARARRTAEIVAGGLGLSGRLVEDERLAHGFDVRRLEQVLVGSADLMPRNLNRRVEILFPVEDQAIVRRLRDEILDVYWRDNVKARFMQADGSYVHAHPAAGEEPLDSQAWFIEHAADRPSRSRQTSRRAKRRPAGAR